jgi:hypothetical protein
MRFMQEDHYNLELVSGTHEQEIQQDFFNNYLERQTGMTNPFLAMTMFLEQIEEGRYISEYCTLMANELSLGSPHVSVELSDRSSHAKPLASCSTQISAKMTVS